MAEIQAAAERIMEATSAEIYSVISDIERHHPHILPPAFSQLRVERGGIGAGTVITYRLKTGGHTYRCRATIAEPQPGRVLTETLDDGTVTTFTVAPRDGRTLVRIEVRYTRKGLRGRVEQRFVPGALTPLFERELELLDEYTRTEALQPTASVAHQK